MWLDTSFTSPRPLRTKTRITFATCGFKKLLYYVQGWHLAAVGLPCFSETIEAWQHGPVVRSLYPTFKEFPCAIPPTQGSDPDSLTQRGKDFIRSIWDIYKGYSATALRDMINHERPWIAARGSLPPEPANNAEITTSAMREFFFPRYVELLKRKDSRIDVTTWHASAADVAAGRVRTAKDLRRELRDRNSRGAPK